MLLILDKFICTYVTTLTGVHFQPVRLTLGATPA
jgi:hypothetical protein